MPLYGAPCLPSSPPSSGCVCKCAAPMFQVVLPFTLKHIPAPKCHGPMAMPVQHSEGGNSTKRLVEMLDLLPKCFVQYFIRSAGCHHQTAKI